MAASGPHIATWLISACVITGIIVRPWKLPEALWAVLGAAALILFSLIPLPAAWMAVRKGTDVYLFLTGMMLLSELARHEGLFDWLAACAVQRSRGSPSRLFGLVYAVGTVVTIFLSNDATAVVLTPAVYAAAAQAKAKPLPYLFVCAFIANAASFVLPISNPANLVVYGAHMPSSGQVAGGIRHCLRSVDSGHVRLPALHAARRARRRDRARHSSDRACHWEDVSPPAALQRPQSCCSWLRVSIGNWVCPRFWQASSRRWRFCSMTRMRAMDAREGHLLERAAAGRRPVRAGRGHRSDRRSEAR